MERAERSGVLGRRATMVRIWKGVTGDEFLSGALAVWAAMWLLGRRLAAASPGGWPWRVALAWVALALSLRLADEMERAWELWRRPDALPPYHPFSNSERTTLATSESLDKAARNVAERLHRHFPRVRSREQEDGIAFYADRRWKGVIGCPLMCLGALVIILGSVAGARFDVTPTPVELTPGEQAQIAGLPISVALESLAPRPPNEVEAVVRVSEGSRRYERTLSAGHPLFLGLDWVHLIGSGAAISVSATGHEGEAELIQVPARGETLEEEAVLLFHSPQEEHDLVLPGARLALRVILSSSPGSAAHPNFLVQAFRPTNPNPLLSEYVTGEMDLEAGEVQLHLRPMSFVRVQASRRISLWLYVLGALLWVSGTVWQSFFYPHRAWVRVRTRRGGVAMDVAVERSPFVVDPLEEVVDCLTGERE